MTTEHAARRPYRTLLGQRHAAALLGWSIVARLPLGMVPLGLLLLARGEGASYGAAGAVAASYGLALAVGAPIAGRLVDRRGPRGVLLRRALGYPSLLVLVAVLAAADAPLVAVAVAAACAGAAIPPVAPTVRTVWPRLAPAELRGTAYALEASLQEVFFVAGPLLAAALAALDPVAGVLGAALAAAVGTTLVARLPPVAEAVTAGPSGGGLLGALETAGVRTLAAFALSLGLAFGTVEVAMPAFAEEHGARELGGLALAAFSAGSLLGGMVAGSRTNADDRRRLLLLAPVLVASLALLLVAWSVPTLCVLSFLAGIPIAPAIAAAYGLIDRVSPTWAIAEAFAWFGTSVGLGAAIGIALGGVVVDAVGTTGAFALGPLLVACGVACTTARRGTLARAA